MAAIPKRVVGAVALEMRETMLPLMRAAGEVVVSPVFDGAALLIVIALVLNIPAFVKFERIPIVVPVCVPDKLIVLLQILLLFTPGEEGPPPDEMAVNEVVPDRFVNVMMLFETVSATSEGVLDVTVKVTVPEDATRSILQIFDLQLNNPTVEF